eukprot:3719449-Pyramimonas_sp.AAC.1
MTKSCAADARGALGLPRQRYALTRMPTCRSPPRRTHSDDTFFNRSAQESASRIRGPRPSPRPAGATSSGN